MNGEDVCEAKLSLICSLNGPDEKDENDIGEGLKPGPLLERPIIANMSEKRLIVSWKPYIPFVMHFPCTYKVEMCELPEGDWFVVGSGIKGCTYEIRDLNLLRDYRFRVSVESKNGVSDPSPYTQTNRLRLLPPIENLYPYLVRGIDFRPKIPSPLPKDFDIERPPYDKIQQPPV